ncbi:uncharacterized protein ACO6RY_16672 [Pungitius sinensis]
MSLMKDGTRSEDLSQVSRQQLYGDYVHFYLQPRAEVAPCCDPSLLQQAARYLRGGPEPPGPFTVLPFHRAVAHHRACSSAYGRKHLCAFSRATQLLETICLNLYLQPWKKEIRTLKTFTGAFIYGLVPVFSSSTIQSVLASIGYVPGPDTQQSEYRLREDANPDRAMLLAFELLLARVECDHLLEILEKDQLEPQEFLKVLQERMGPSKLDGPTEKKTGMRENEEEDQKMEEVPLNLDSRLAVEPQAEPRGCPLVGVDQSIMEMQMTYPDLAFRGRPLLPDKPKRTNRTRRDVPTTSTSDPNGDSNGPEVPKIEHIKGTHTTARSKDHSGADEVDDDQCRGSGCNICNSDGSREDGRLRALPITLRAASEAEQTLKHGEPTAETPAWTPADVQDKRKEKSPVLSSTDRVQRKTERVKDTKQEVERKQENHRDEGHTPGERSGAGEETVLIGPEPSHAASRSPQCDPAMVEEQKQHTGCPHVPPATGTAGSQSFEGGDGAEQQESKDPVRDEEQLTKSFVMVELHKK